MGRIDFWIGTRLFHPPIIWLCQRLGLSQHAFSRYSWMIATLTFVGRIGSGPQYTGAGYIAFAICMGVTISASTALVLGIPTTPLFGFRMVLWGIAAVQAIAQAMHPHLAAAIVWEMSWTAFGLAGEYAKTIKTIPPRTRRQTRTATKEALP